MTATAILAELRTLGVTVTARGEDLVIAPASRVPLDLKARLRERKAEVVALLRDDAGILAEAQRVFDGAIVETMSRENGEILWQERLRRQDPAARYLRPWPEALVGLGRHGVGRFDRCGDCGAGTWGTYGDWPLCLNCANRRAAEMLSPRVANEARGGREPDVQQAP